MLGQISLDEGAERQACKELQEAYREFEASVNKSEDQQQKALDRLHAARGALVINFSYSLEALCEVLEGAQ